MLNIIVIYGGKSGGDYDNFMSEVSILKLSNLEWVKTITHGMTYVITIINIYYYCCFYYY